MQARLSTPPPSTQLLRRYCSKLKAALEAEEVRQAHAAAVGNMFGAAQGERGRAGRLRSMVDVSRVSCGTSGGRVTGVAVGGWAGSETGMCQASSDGTGRVSVGVSHRVEHIHVSRSNQRLANLETAVAGAAAATRQPGSDIVSSCVVGGQPGQVRGKQPEGGSGPCVHNAAAPVRTAICMTDQAPPAAGLRPEKAIGRKVQQGYGCALHPNLHQSGQLPTHDASGGVTRCVHQPTACAAPPAHRVGSGRRSLIHALRQSREGGLQRPCNASEAQQQSVSSPEEPVQLSDCVVRQSASGSRSHAIQRNDRLPGSLLDAQVDLLRGGTSAILARHGYSAPMNKERHVSK